MSLRKITIWGAIITLVVLGIGCGGCEKSVKYKEDGRGWFGPEGYGPADYYPAWSPDGRTIAYFHKKDDFDTTGADTSGIYLIDTTGSNRRLFVTGGNPAAPLICSWSPDSKCLAFNRGGVIYRMDINGSDLRLLASRENGFYNSSPDWSPDGDWIVYRVFADEPYTGIWIMDADSGGNKHQISTWGFEPDWSPDGKRIVYDGIRGTEWQIFIMNSDGSHCEQITFFNPKYPKGRSQWSPDGEWIAFGATSDGGCDLWKVNLDTKTPQKIMDNGGQPSWSPDGRRIVYPRYMRGDQEVWRGSVRLWIINADGTNNHQITF